MNMIKNAIRIILIESIIMLCISCSMGIDDGSDIIGKWMNPDYQYEEFITFKTNNIGYYEIKRDHKVWTSKDFIWQVELGQYYKLVKLSGEMDTNFEYYFSSDKKYLYLRQSGFCCFKSWVKFRDE
jgi:hypothetical protein